MSQDSCFDEWLDQFRKLESWYEEITQEEAVLWEAFQAGWDSREHLIRQGVLDIRSLCKK